jgi:hypothetical protein
LITDFLPRGYLDDLLIVTALVSFGLYLVPRVVFIDARKVGAQAACGLVFLSLTAQAYHAAAPPLSSEYLTPSCNTIQILRQFNNKLKGNADAINDFAESAWQIVPDKQNHDSKKNNPAKSALAADREATASADDTAFAPKQTNLDICSNPKLLPNFSQLLDLADSDIGRIAIDIDFCRAQNAPLMLLIRGGQGQFYAWADSRGAVLSSNSSPDLKPPQLNASGFFNAAFNNMLSPQAGIYG